MSAGDSPHADRYEPSLDEALRRLADQLMAEHGGDAQAALRALQDDELLQSLATSAAAEGIAFGPAAARGRREDEPRFELRDSPPEPVVFGVRVDLDGSQPPIWRRLEVAGDLPLPQVHTLLQASFGWFDAHLHSFAPVIPGSGPHMRPFPNPGTAEFCADNLPPEHEVRLDQVVTDVGDQLLYEYDFGDSWDHRITVETVRPRTDGDPRARLLGGDRAAPPEDCGGIWAYNDLVAVLDGRAATGPADWLGELLAQMPPDFDPADAGLGDLDLDELLDTIDRAQQLAGDLVGNPRFAPIAAELIDQIAQVDQLQPFAVLVDDAELPLTAEPPETARAAVVEGLTPQEAEAVVAPWALLLQLLGREGVRLTGAGYLPPAVVHALFTGLHLDEHWIGKGNREELTLPVAQLRESATALGLVRKAKGRLVPTKAALAAADDPIRLWHLLADGLPRARGDRERSTTALALFCFAGRQPVDVSFDGMAAGLLGALGWHVDAVSRYEVRDGALPVWTVMERGGGLDDAGVPTPAARRLARAALLQH